MLKISIAIGIYSVKNDPWILDIIKYGLKLDF